MESNMKELSWLKWSATQSQVSTAVVRAATVRLRDHQGREEARPSAEGSAAARWCLPQGLDDLNPAKREQCSLTRCCWQLAVGTGKGNMLLYNRRTSKKIPIMVRDFRRVRESPVRAVGSFVSWM